MSDFTRLLADSFPSIVASPRDEACILSRYYHADRPEMSVISDAAKVVENFGARSALVAKLQQTHPTRKRHHEQFDERAFDVLTEACAFAWAASIAGLGTPTFCDAEGTPDVRCDSALPADSRQR